MTTMTQEQIGAQGETGLSEHEVGGIERRQSRRHDFEQSEVVVDRWDGSRRTPRALGRVLDLSAHGIRIRTTDSTVRPNQQIRLRLQLPVYAGISPFVDVHSDVPQGTNEWVGWMAVTRVVKEGEAVREIAGRLVDMDEMDRGMLGLYLSTQPLSA